MQSVESIHAMEVPDFSYLEQSRLACIFQAYHASRFHAQSAQTHHVYSCTSCIVVFHCKSMGGWQL